MPFVLGPEVVVRSMSKPVPRGRSRTAWQYHPRSDLHSKQACWVVLADLLSSSKLLQRHAAEGAVVLGVNVRLEDFARNRPKDLDLVIGRPRGGSKKSSSTMLDLAETYHVDLTVSEMECLAGLPVLNQGQTGSVLVALEAKAAMTEHSKALPRLYDELTSSHSTVHGNSSNALAVGLVMVNASEVFVSPPRSPDPRRPEYSKHKQPSAAAAVVDKIGTLPRRSGTHEPGFDGLAIVVVKCRNDGSPVSFESQRPAPEPNSIFHYGSMISRVAHEYDARFGDI